MFSHRGVDLKQLLPGRPRSLIKFDTVFFSMSKICFNNPRYFPSRG